MKEQTPLWERRERSHDDSWFHAVRYPLVGMWYPVRWQGLLLLAIEGSLLFFVFGLSEGVHSKIPEPWRDWVVWCALAVFVILFAVAIVKTRWRWS